MKRHCTTLVSRFTNKSLVKIASFIKAEYTINLRGATRLPPTVIRLLLRYHRSSNDNIFILTEVCLEPTIIQRSKTVNLRSARPTLIPALCLEGERAYRDPVRT